MRGAGVSAEAPGPAVIFAHGNAELIDGWPAVLGGYQAMGVSVLMVEYRGYGRSDGSPTQKGLTDDFVRFAEMLSDRPEVDGERLIYHGRSIGGGVICQLAAQRAPAALILQSTFTSAADMAARMGFPSFLVRDKFDSRAVVEAFDGPLLLMHGRRDRVIGYRHSERLAAVARQGRLRPYDCDHNDFPMESGAFWGDVEGFLREAGVLE
ncbi:MAG: alpha/beta hydrolase [Planctomycetaceae bacterium]|nr:alpha/beta hydrolase [Planctomycetaceae bacterium]